MIIGLLHVSFLSANLARSRLFYENLLGLQPDPTRPDLGYDGIWYSVAPSQQIHLLCLPDPEAGLQRPLHGGRDRHVALRVTDIGVLAARLEQAGIAYTRSRSGRSALFCRDPDGNALEFIAE